MASCKAVFENIMLAACAIPAHGWTAAMHTPVTFSGDYLHAVGSGFPH